MLYAHDGATPRQTLVPGHHTVSDAVWIDLLDPTDAERAEAERLTHLRVPAREEIAEIESSSRVFTENGALYLSMPYTFVAPDGRPTVTPVGFVLSEHRLLTLRFDALPAFEAFGEAFAHGGQTGSVAAFIGLLETIVDRLADFLETVAAELSRLSKLIFRSDGQHGRRKARHAARSLHAILAAVGGHGDGLGNLRDSVLGIIRVVRYAQQMAEAWTPRELKTRLQILRRDVESLNDYEQQLTVKVSFLLDAVLGFINIEQNNTVKVLTIASVVGIPPTFVVGLYGMNFKSMPEYDWHYGYAFGWAMIVLSVILPLVWLRVKGWL